MPDPKFMQRCLDLALAGLGKVSPNPLVGAVLVHQDNIIGEGWHRAYGQAHAEVEAIRDAIRKGNGHLLSQATLYVNLEPCNHHGKTPPCTELILEKKIPEVVVGLADPHKLVNGQGIQRLRDAGIAVSEMMQQECRDFNKRFVTFHEKKRPYIIIKYAQTRDAFIAPETSGQGIYRISGEAAHELVHKWRSEEDAVLVGYNTAKADNPQLTTRQWPARNPVRVTVDANLNLPGSLHLFDGTSTTLIFNTIREGRTDQAEYVRYDASQSLPEQIGTALHQRNIQSVILEGGLRLIQQFVNEDYWDEARIFTSPKLLGRGIPAPFIQGTLICNAVTGDDELQILQPAG